MGGQPKTPQTKASRDVSGRSERRSARFLVAGLLAFSLINATKALYDAYHWPLFVPDAIDNDDQFGSPLKKQLKSMGVKEIAYRTDRAYNDADAGAFFLLQLRLAPILLRRVPIDDDDHPLLLMNFRATRRIGALPGFTLLEDFGDGLGLFRKQ